MSNGSSADQDWLITAVPFEQLRSYINDVPRRAPVMNERAYTQS
jgi:hypothetical protein